MKRCVLALAVLGISGCSGVRLYQDTDVAQPRDFGDVKVALDVHMSSGLMHSGNLEYAGSGDLVQVYRGYLADMKGQGWMLVADEIQGQRATGTLRKDNRTCALEFTSVAGQIRISVKVAPTK